MRKPTSWNEIWMRIADVVADRSKDPSTQVGAVLVSPDNRESAVGYNGLPSGIEDTNERWEKPAKYDLVLHAEENVIANCNRRPEGWTLYVTHVPCQKCARVIIQSGIKKVVFGEEKEPYMANVVEDFLKEAGIELVKFSTLNSS